MIDSTDTQSFAQLQNILHLPPLPAIATQLLQEINQPETDIDKLAGMIEQDPGLAARIIGIANSAYFARQHEVCSVRDAIVRVLGLNIVRGLAIGIALSKPFTLDACPNFDLERYWYRAFMTGTLAAQVGKNAKLSPEQQDCCFLAGLLHNLGQIVLVHAFPSRMNDIFEEWQTNPERPLLDLEREQLAVDEIGAGRLISRNWHLPHCVADVIRCRHHVEDCAGNRPLVEWVSYCSSFATLLFDDPEAEIPPQTGAGNAFSQLQNDLFTEYMNAVRQLDDQVRALANGLMQSS